MADLCSQKILTNVISLFLLPLLCQTRLARQLFLPDSTPRLSTPSYRSDKYLDYRDLNWKYIQLLELAILEGKINTLLDPQTPIFWSVAPTFSV